MPLLLYIFWMSSVGLGLAQAQTQCPSGWFGNGCVYKCRCTLSCEIDGSCSNESHCQLGWFGPACQYVDLAQNSSVTSSLYPNNVLTDGDDTTCNTDNTLQTLTLSWATSSYTITWLRLTARNIDSFDTVTIQFSKDGGNTFLNVTCVKRPNIDSQTKDVFCDLNTPVNLVKLAGVKSLCSVYVSGGRNVALKQATVQSGNYSETGTIYWSGLAVDGNINQNFYQGNSCTATDPTINPAFWSVSLSQPVKVSRYVLYNRGDVSATQHRLKGFQLTSFDVNKAQVYGYNDTAATPLSVYNVVPDPIVSGISSVRVTANGGVDLLTICEFELFGETECISGRYGRECEYKCNCADKKEACFVSTGGCTSGCATGYTGESCTQHCGHDLYGKDCKSACSDFCATPNQITESSCNHISGICTLGCQSGYENSKCTEACRPGTYGSDCKSQCSKFCMNSIGDNRSCDHINGTCLHGCVNGYEGPTCMLSCRSGRYGKGCNSTCNQICAPASSFKESSCHHISGDCLYGCLPGYSGPICSKGPIEKLSPTNIGLITGICVIAVVAMMISALIVIYYRRKIRMLTGGRERSYDVPNKREQEVQQPQYSNIVSGEEYQVQSESRTVKENSSLQETENCYEDFDDLHIESLQMEHLHSEDSIGKKNTKCD